MAKASKNAASKTTEKAPAKAAKKAAPEKETKQAAPKKAAKGADTKKPARKANPAFMAPLTPDNELAQVVGNKPIPRTEIVKKVWDYIKSNNLQDAANRRMINADDKLRPLFGKDQISMFELAKVVNQHVK